MINIPIEEEGITKANLKALDNLFKQCKFNTILTHAGIVPNPSTTEISMYPTDDDGLLQQNSIYCVCTPKDFYDVPIVKKLREYIPKRELKANLRLSRMEREVRRFPIPTIPDIKFVDEVTGDEVGWYNRQLNILWLSDVGHYPDRAASNLTEILQVVSSFQVFGKLKSKPITIGCDPEFEILDKDGNLVSAYTLFQDDNHQNDIGCDGHIETGEIRPQHGTTPLVLLRNIKRIMRKLGKAKGLSDNLRVCAGGGTKVTTGGHIHFGIPRVPDDLKDVMWEKVAKHVLSKQTGPRGRSSDLCTKTGGNVVRAQPWGVEWRPLQSWIVNEEVSGAVLCTTYAIVKAYYDGELQKHIAGENFYTKLPLYPIYKEYIDKFISFFVDGNSPPLENRDIIKEWKISKLANKDTVQIFSPSQWIIDYFTPINTQLPQSVTIYISFGPYSDMRGINIPLRVEEQLNNFAARHFTNYNPLNEASDVRRQGAYTACLYLPESWSQMPSRTEFLRELKGIVKDLAIILGKGE